MNNHMNRRSMLGALAVLPFVGLLETTARATKSAPTPKLGVMNEVFTKGFGTYRYDFQKTRESRVAWTAAISKALDLNPKDLHLTFPRFSEVSIPNQFAADRFTGFYISPRYAIRDSEGVWRGSNWSFLSGTGNEAIRRNYPEADKRILDGALLGAIDFYQECDPKHVTYLGEPENPNHMTQKWTYEPWPLGVVIA